MKKIPRKSLIITRAHKAFVIGCIAVTAAGVANYGMRWYRYFSVLRPELQKKELLENQKLLSEGSSDKLQDSAPNLKL